MAKKFLVVLLALCVVFAMAGCGDKDPVDPGDGGGGGGSGVKAVEITFSENWSGVDLLDSVFSFAANDKIEATGKVIAVGGSAPEFVFNDRPGDWGVPTFQKTGIAAGTALDVNVDLTAAMITNIAAGSPKAIRMAGNNVTADTLKVTFQQIKITRGSTVLLDLAAHLATLEVGNNDIGQILPGAKGFQKAGNVTAKVIEE